MNPLALPADHGEGGHKDTLDVSPLPPAVGHQHSTQHGRGQTFPIPSHDPPSAIFPVRPICPIHHHTIIHTTCSALPRLLRRLLALFPFPLPFLFPFSPPLHTAQKQVLYTLRRPRHHHQRRPATHHMGHGQHAHRRHRRHRVDLTGTGGQRCGKAERSSV